MLTFERMREDETGICVDLAAHAFADYEYFSVYVPNDRKRMRFLLAMLQSEFRANRSLANLFTAKEDGKVVAVAMLCDPDYKKPTDMDYMKAGFGKVFLRGGIRNVSAWNAMEAKALTPCRGLTGNTWYLNLLTVDSVLEGRGIGSKMMQEFLIPYVRDHGGATLCLFTNSEINRKFYLKNCFEEFHAEHFSYRGKSIGSWSYRFKIQQV